MKASRIKVQSVSYTSGEKKKLQNFANLNIRTRKVLKHGSKSTRKKKKKKVATDWNVWFLYTESATKSKPVPFN